MEDVVSLEPSGPVAANGEAKPSRTRGKAGGQHSELPTFEELSQYFHLPTKKACEELGVGLVVLKRACRRFGLLRWPYRKPRTAAAQDQSQDVSSGSDPEEGHEAPTAQPRPQLSDTSTPEIVKPVPLRDGSTLLQAACMSYNQQHQHNSQQQHGHGRNPGQQADGSPAGCASGTQHAFAWKSPMAGDQPPPGAGFRMAARVGPSNLGQMEGPTLHDVLGMAAAAGVQCSNGYACPPDFAGPATSLLQQQRFGGGYQPPPQHYHWQPPQLPPLPSHLLLGMSSLPAQLPHHAPPPQQLQQQLLQTLASGAPTSQAAPTVQLPTTVVDHAGLMQLAAQLVEVPGLAGQLAAAMATVIQEKCGGGGCGAPNGTGGGVGPGSGGA